MRSEYKILAAKEEANTSYICQAYNNFFAQNNKARTYKALAMLKNLLMLTKEVIDQYGLVKACIFALNATPNKLWVDSFKKGEPMPVNTETISQMVLDDW